jgi:hypothetical protein
MPLEQSGPVFGPKLVEMAVAALKRNRSREGDEGAQFAQIGDQRFAATSWKVFCDLQA